MSELIDLHPQIQFLCSPYLWNKSTASIENLFLKVPLVLC